MQSVSELTANHKILQKKQVSILFTTVSLVPSLTPVQKKIAQ